MLDEAAREFRRVAELRPAEGNAHFYIGLVALKQARWREAMEALRLAAERGGSRPAVFHNLAFAFEQLGRLDEAEAAYAEAATRARTDAKVYLGWGIVALKRGDYAGATGRLDRARNCSGKCRRPRGSGPAPCARRAPGSSSWPRMWPRRAWKPIPRTPRCATTSPSCGS